MHLNTHETSEYDEQILAMQTERAALKPYLDASQDILQQIAAQRAMEVYAQSLYDDALEQERQEIRVLMVLKGYNHAMRARQQEHLIIDPYVDPTEEQATSLQTWLYDQRAFREQYPITPPMLIKAAQEFAQQQLSAETPLRLSAAEE